MVTAIALAEGNVMVEMSWKCGSSYKKQLALMASCGFFILHEL